MATQLQELQAKRKELQVTNPNATMLDAKNALSSSTAPIANAPVAGVAPAITPIAQIPATLTTPSVHANGPSATEATNQAVRQQNAVKVQNEIAQGVRPQVGQQATPAQTPEIIQQAQAPVKEVAPVETPVKETTQVTTSNATQAPTTPTTPATPKITPTTPVIQTPRDIAKQNKVNQYSGMTSSQFVDLIKQGQIPSEISAQLAQTNPEFQKAQAEYSNLQKAQNRTAQYQSVYNGLTGQPTTPQVDPFTQITEKFMKLMGANAGNTSYVEAFKQSLTQNDAVITKTNELNAKQEELNTQIKARDDLLKSYKQQYKDVPLSVVIAMASRDAQPINEQIATLQNERDRIKADLTYETELAKGEYDAQVKDMERNQRIQEGLANTLMQSQLGLVSKQASMQMEADFARQQAYENLNDPATAISNMMQMYQSKGIPFTESLQTKLANFQTSGLSLGQYLDQMTKDIQAKPEYKALTKPTEAPTTKEIDVGGKKVTVQWNGKEWTPVQGANIERAVATQKYGTTPAVRNFNPGNIMDTGFGGKKVEGERFTVFDSPQEGFNALVAKIQNIQNGGSKVYSPDMTLLQYIGKYAPSSGGNNPKSYATAIANNLGITIDTKIGQIDPVKLAEEHARHEDGNSYRMLQDLGIVGGGTGGEVMGSFGIPFDYQNRIEQMIPVQLRNTEAEQAKLKQNVVNLYKSGISVEDAALRYMGFSPKSGTDTQKASQLISQARGLGEKLPENYFTNLSDYVNRGDMKGAEDYTNRVVEGVLKGELGSEFVSTPSLDFSKATLDRVKSFIEKNKDKIGPVAGRISDLEKKFVGDKDYQALKTLLGGSLADTRRAFGGTAVTNSELQALRDFVGMDTNMPVENLITALEENYNQLQSKYNTQRGFYGATQTEQSTAPQNDITTTVNNLVPDSYKKYF